MDKVYGKDVLVLHLSQEFDVDLMFVARFGLVSGSIVN